MKKNNIILWVVCAVVVAGIAWLKLSGINLASLTNGNDWFFPIVVLLAALLDSINPCAFSILLITIAFLFSLGHERKRIVQIGVTYIAGIYLAYILIGIGIAALALKTEPGQIVKQAAETVTG